MNIWQLLLELDYVIEALCVSKHTQEIYEGRMYAKLGIISWQTGRQSFN